MSLDPKSSAELGRETDVPQTSDELNADAAQTTTQSGAMVEIETDVPQTREEPNADAAEKTTHPAPRVHKRARPTVPWKPETAQKAAERKG